jgi:uncharacterized protein YjbJ (UPF0337 family)
LNDESNQVSKQQVTELNWNQVNGDWSQLSRRLAEKWGRLTDDDLNAVAGKQGQFLAVLQLRYGYGAGRAEHELKKFIDGLSIQVPE